MCLFGFISSNADRSYELRLKLASDDVSSEIWQWGLKNVSNRWRLSFGSSAIGNEWVFDFIFAEFEPESFLEIILRS